jgi:hypothetical protein
MASRCADWPFYLNHDQRALLRKLRGIWGKDAIVQIYDGQVRIRAGSGVWRLGPSELLKCRKRHWQQSCNRHEEAHESCRHDQAVPA